MKRFTLIVLLAIILAGLGACMNGVAYRSKVEKAHPALGQIVEVNGTAVHVIERGNKSGPVIVMIHGASANANEFTYTLSPRLEADHHILMIDRPGHGYSGRPAHAERLGVQAAQISGAIDALVPGKKVIIVGHSFGGAVALRTALDNPDTVGGLVLLAPVTHDWGSDASSWYNRWAATPVLGQVFTQLVPFIGPAQGKAGVASVFAPKSAPEGYYEKSAIALLFRPSSFRANASDVQALRTELAAQQDRYTQLNIPVIVFSGAKDTVLKPQLHVGKLKQQIELELIKLPDEGHMPHHAHGEAVAGAISRLASTLN